MTRKTIHVSIDGTRFSLNGENVSYCFHVDESSGDLRSDHFGRSITGAIPSDPAPAVADYWTQMPDRVRREFPDQGRGDVRIPAIRLIQSDGYAASALRYQSHVVMQGKPALPGLPATFSPAEDVNTLVVRLFDEYSEVAADLTYSIFPRYDAIVRRVSVTNQGKRSISVETLASLSVDFPCEDLEIVGLRGDWLREAQRQRRKVDYGVQSLGSATGFSSHLHNPFLALVHPSTTESQGEAWGFSLVYSGSFAAHIEKGSQGLIRTTIGFHSDHLSWYLAPGETLTSPECVSIYSSDGIGGMSRSLHGLYRHHLMRSKFTTEARPVLLNSWEALYFNIDQNSMYRLADESAALGVELLVMDDGWFGKEYPRTSDIAGLGDWVPDPVKFPDGFGPMVSRITSLNVANSSAKLRFGIWIEPEMVNPQSTLYRKHPDWVLHAGKYPRTEQRNQLVLNLALPDVQEFIINSMTDLLHSAKISYVKWDQNRAISEISSPSGNHAYMLGLYRVFDVLTSRFPEVLWEGCASGGGRFDPGVLQFFPQIWASDNTDPVDRIFIQFGLSLAYPASCICAHVSAAPNHQTGRITPLSFRAHVAMMGGSFGFELDPSEMSEDERKEIPRLIELAERLRPTILTGDLWRLTLPQDSNWPSALFVALDGAQAVLFVFQLAPRVNYIMPRVKLQGLDPKAEYCVDEQGPFSGSVLMNIGLQYSFNTEHASKVVFLKKIIS